MIKARYEEMETAANEIKGAGTLYKVNVQNLYKVIERLETIWKGKDNLSYVSKANNSKAALESLGDVINDYGDFLKISANIIRETQEEIASSASR